MSGSPGLAAAHCRHLRRSAAACQGREGAVSRRREWMLRQRPGTTAADSGHGSAPFGQSRQQAGRQGAHARAAAAGRRRPARPAGAALAVVLGGGAGPRDAFLRRLADAVADPADLRAAGGAGRGHASPSAMDSGCCARRPLGVHAAAARRTLRLGGSTWAAMALSLRSSVRFLWQRALWQNSIRLRWRCRSAGAARCDRAMALASSWSSSCRALFRGLGGWVRRRLGRYVPERVSLVGVAAAVPSSWTHGRRGADADFMNGSDRSSRRFDALIEPQFPAPDRPDGGRQRPVAGRLEGPGPGRTGVRGLGADGRRYRGLHRAPGQGPIRVYAGLNSADDAEERAELVLREMIRVGAFERSVLIVAMPTGTGWMDPAAMDTLEYLHGGDTAIVACSIPTCRAGSRSWSSPASAAQRAGRSSARSTGTGRACRGTSGRSSICRA